jgi:hypothetical protein
MTQSTIPWPLSEVETASDQLTAAVKERLAHICAHPPMHARFLNTLSLMEHIGSRKIMASRSGQDLGGDTLRHLAEETRHAYFFKRAAEKLARSGLGFRPSELMAGAAARGYMGRLDAGITRALSSAAATPLPYLYMSLIVELRAIWFYRLYQEVLDRHAPALSLKSVLAEEELHLAAILARLSEMDGECTLRVTRFREIEQHRFRALWAAVEAECNGDRLAAE